MRALACPDRAAARQHLANALANNPPSDQDLDALVALYDVYDELGGVPDDHLRAQNLALALRNAVRDSYNLTQKNRRLSFIRTLLLQGIERCPVCGIAAPRELDHFLPRSVFKCLAIYVRNLVPYCHDCNQLKSAHVADDDNHRFVHPYFDDIPDIQFVQVSLDLDGAALRAEYSIVGMEGLPEPLRERLAYQFERLKLNERFCRELVNYMSGHTAALHIIFNASAAPGVSDFLAHQAEVERTRLHRNDWRAVLLRALSAHGAFCAGGFRDVFPLPPRGGGPLLAVAEAA
ncbi:MAG TPA: HNH endonuclease signature motif containing protein [Rhizomicrobium sp.]|jgi:hypothetical protein